MRNLNVEMTEHTYNGLLRTYAGACLVPDTRPEHVDMYIRDAWGLLEQMKEQGIDLNIYVLNSMLLLHSNAFYTQELHEQVLPLYERYKILPDVYTYQHLMEHYSNIDEIGPALETYDRMQKQNITPNNMILAIYMSVSFRSNNNDRIVDALEQHIERDIMPHK